MIQKKIKDILTSARVGDEVSVSGWVRTRRDSKDFSFIQINDGSSLSSLQVVAQKTIKDYKENVLSAQTGAALRVKGEIVESLGKGQSIELSATSVELVGPSAEDYPLQKKRHSFEFLRTILHLRPRTNTFGAVSRVRSKCAQGVHRFFEDKGFIYLNSPIITTSDCEGAGDMFQVTTLDLENREEKLDFSKDFFGEKAFLTVSGQLEGEIFASALTNVYTFGPTFRAENSNTPRHLAEFWMIEPEMAFCALEGNMELAEEFIKYIISYALNNCEEDMEFFNSFIDKGIIKSLEEICNSEFSHLTYDEAIKILEASNKSFEFPVSWGMDLQTEHERYLSEEYLKKPVFVTNYPKEIKAFYMRLDDDERTVSAMDLLVPRCGEIIGGSQREERYDVLLRRLKECNMPKEHYDWYLDLRRFGSVPHSGFGVGFERVVMYLTGMSNVRDVISFPRTPGNAKF